MHVKLIVVGGKASKREVSLTPPTVLGRSRDAGLAVGHPMISRRHCEVVEQDGLLMVRDLGSLNGTYVGGRRIREAPLPPGERFSIGPLTFRIEYEYAGDLNNLPPVVPEMPDTTEHVRPPAAKPSPIPAHPPAEKSPVEKPPADKAPASPKTPATVPVEPPAEEEELDELDFQLVEDPELDNNLPKPNAPPATGNVKRIVPGQMPQRPNATPPAAPPPDPPGDPLDPEAQALDDFLKGID